MASISNPKPTPPAVKPAPAPAPQVAKAPIKAPVLKTSAPVPAKTANPIPVKASVTPKVVKAKAPKVEKEIVLDETTGLARNQPASFRWVCLDALKETWPESGVQKDWNQSEAVAACHRIYKEKGGKKEFTDEIWATQLTIIRAWLRSKGINKPLPGDKGDRKEMTDEQKQTLRDRLATGRAKRATKGATAGPDDDEADAEEAAEVTEE